MPLTVRVLGAIRDECEIKTALEQAFASSAPAESVTVQFSWHTTDWPGTEEVASADLLICFLPTQDRVQGEGLAGMKFLRDVITRYGAWRYLPVLVVGSPEHPHLKPRLLGLGASRYLEAGCSARKIAQEALSVWKICWWYGEYHRDIPAFVVSKDGVIQRANPFAAQRFPGTTLVGQPFTSVVEGKSEPLEKKHPILLATESQTGVTGVRVTQSGQQLFLVCNPLLRPQAPLRTHEVHAAFVLVLDLGNWSRIPGVAQAFARVQRTDELPGQIVAEGKKLGFRRLRLYRYDAACQRFQGLASWWGEPRTEKEAWFKTFTLQVAEDLPSGHLAASRGESGPRLYVPNSPPEETRQEKLECRFSERAQYETELEKEHVQAWIEAPIWLPPDATGAQVLWGKLSIDNGPQGEPLDSRNLGDVAIFCDLIGYAIQSIERLAQESSVVQNVDRISTDLMRELKSHSELKPHVIERVLQLYLELTGGKVALYRRAGGNQPDRLFLVGEEFPQDSGVPREIRLDGPFAEYFAHFVPQAGSGTGPTEGPQPRIVPSPETSVQKYLQHQKDLTEAEQKYLRSIRSELHIPVVSGDRIHGLVVVVSTEPDAFTQRQVELVRRYQSAVSIWLELARRNDSLNCMGRALADIIPLLPRLGPAELPTDQHGDERFFAGVATLLSAHKGLTWNRVFVFSCLADAGVKTAKLVYALGGLVEDYQQSTNHAELQRWLSEPETTLEMLLRQRLGNPAPHSSRDGVEIRDRLHDTFFEQGRPPLQFSYSEAPEGDSKLPFRWQLQSLGQEAGAGGLPFVGEDVLPPEVVEELNRRYPGVFKANHPIYSFSLWSSADSGQGPLGLVLVDMHRPNPLPYNLTTDRIAATRVVLGLVGDILNARYIHKLYGNYIDALQVLTHPREGQPIKALWDFIKTILRDGQTFVQGLKQDNAAPEAQLALAMQLAQRWLGNANTLAMLDTTIRQMDSQIQRLHVSTTSCTPDLETRFRRFREEYLKTEGLRVSMNWKRGIFEDLVLTGDELILKNLFDCLLENTQQANGVIGTGKPAIPVTIEIDLLPSPCKNFTNLLRITYEDAGVGIAEDCWPLILMNGHTGADDSGRRRGRGLSFLLAQLNAHDATLAFVSDERNPRNDVTGRRKALFVAHFGIRQRIQE